MILPDHEIHKRCQPTKRVFDGTMVLTSNPPQFRHRDVEQEPMVQPYLEENLQPSSLDVRLGNEFRVFERDHREFIDMADPEDITKLVTLGDDEFFTLHPGEFVLGVTIERLVVPDDLVARIEGKSSLGRLGLIVHATAGYIDPGFRGPITLEMTCLHPLAVRLRPGMLIGQFSFQQMAGPAERPYRGRYQGAEGVESSKFGRPLIDVLAEEDLLDDSHVIRCKHCDRDIQIGGDGKWEALESRHLNAAHCHYSASNSKSVGHEPK